MSAAAPAQISDQTPTPYVATLTLSATAECSRRLMLELMPTHLFATLLSPEGLYLSGAHSRLADSNLNLVDRHLMLHVGTSSFWVSPEEATQIRATFEPHGLRVREGS